MKKRRPVEDVKALVSKYQENEMGSVLWERNAALKEIIIQTILFIGSKTFSHALNTIERFWLIYIIKEGEHAIVSAVRLYLYFMLF